MWPDIMWKEVSPGEFTRSLDPMDWWHKLMISHSKEGGRMNLTLTSAVKLEFSKPHDFVSAALHAWKVIRYEQPHVASIFDVDNDQWRYSRITDPGMSDWIDKTFRVEKNLLLQELLPTLKIVQKPTLYVVPKSQALVIRSPHAYIDAMGLLWLWNDLLSDIDNPRPMVAHNEFKNLAPGVFSAISISSPTPDDQMEAQERITKLFQSVPSIGLPYDTSNSPTQTRFRCTIFNAPQTSKIFSAVKARGLTVSHVIHAAVVVALARLSTNPEAHCYSGVIPVDVRKYRPESLSKHSLGLCIMGFETIITPNDFATTAASVRDCYTRGLNDMHKNGRAILLPLIGGMLAAMRSMPMDGSLFLDSTTAVKYSNADRGTDYGI